MAIRVVTGIAQVQAARESDLLVDDHHLFVVGPQKGKHSDWVPQDFDVRAQLLELCFGEEGVILQEG